jgi:tetratricopeptide (TPR) repeat protein
VGDEVKIVRVAAVLVVAAALAFGAWWNLGRTRAAEVPPTPAAGSLNDPPLEKRIRDHADAVARAPSDPVAWARLAMTYHVHEIFAEALTCYDRAIALDPAQVRWIWFRACVLEALDRFDEAVAGAKQVFALAPDYAPARATLARWYLGRGMLDEALEHAAAATDADPSDAGAWLVLAMVRQGRGDWAEGEAAARRALRLPFARSVQSAYAHYVLGRCLQGLGRLEEAKVEIARGRDGDGRFPVTDRWQRDLSEFQIGFRLLVSICHAEMLAGSYETVLPHLQDLRRREPDHLQVLTDLGLVLRELKRYRESEEVLRYGVSIHPAQPVIRAQYALTLEAMGDVDGALRQIDEAVARNPTTGELFETRGMIRMRQGRWDDAVAEFEKSFSVEPDRSWVLVHAGVANLEAGRPDEAERYFQRCREADPGNADVYAGLAIVAARRGRLGDAGRLLDESQRLVPKPTLLQGAALTEIEKARAEPR